MENTESAESIVTIAVCWMSFCKLTVNDGFDSSLSGNAAQLLWFMTILSVRPLVIFVVFQFVCVNCG